MLFICTAWIAYLLVWNVCKKSSIPIYENNSNDNKIGQISRSSGLRLDLTKDRSGCMLGMDRFLLETLAHSTETWCRYKHSLTKPAKIIRLLPYNT